MQRSGLPVGDRFAVAVGERAAGDHDQVDQRADAEAAGREQPEHARADLADVEAVDAEPADEDAQQQRDQARFRAGVRVNGFCRCHGAAALWADNGFVDQLRAAMSAVFHGVSPPSLPPQRPRYLSHGGDTCHLIKSV